MVQLQYGKNMVTIYSYLREDYDVTITEPEPATFIVI